MAEDESPDLDTVMKNTMQGMNSRQRKNLRKGNTYHMPDFSVPLRQAAKKGDNQSSGD